MWKPEPWLNGYRCNHATIESEQFLDYTLRLLLSDSQLAESERSVAVVEDGFEGFETRQVRILPNQADGNFIAPLIGLFECLIEIRRVVALFLEDLHTRIEPLVSVVLVVGDTGAEYIYQGKTFVRDGAFEHLDQVLLFAAESPRHVSRATDHCQWHRVNRVFNAPMRRALGFHAFDARWRSLARRQTVNLIVHHDVSQVDVSPHRMNE